MSEQEKFDTIPSDEDKGFAPIGMVPIRESDTYKKKKAEAYDLITNKKGYSRALRTAKIEEAMRTSEFPLLFGDIIDRELGWKYTSIGTPLSPLFRNKTVTRIGEPSAWYRGFGVASRLKAVGEQGQYPARRLDEERYTIQVDKYGATVPISWETDVNDDLGFFDTISEDLATSATNTDAWIQTGTFLDANGPRAAVFTSNGGQTAVSNLPLNIDNLATAVQEMAEYLSDEGEPINNRPHYLVVGPALELMARSILTSANRIIAGDTDRTLGERNVLSGYGLELIVDPWIPVVANNVANTAWFLVSDVAPAAGFARLSGHESPQLWLKSADAVQVGGGMVGAMMGSFDNDTITYRIRHIVGATNLDPLALWGSAGQIY